MKIIFSIIFSTIVVFGTSQDTLSLKEVYIKLQNRLPDPDTINDHIKESAKIIGLTDSLFICKSLTYEDFKSNDPEDAKLVSRIHSIGLDSDL